MPMQHEVVSREEWLKRRISLLEQEKAITKLRDLVCAERLRLPWVRVEKDYVFDGPDGKQSLADLFRGRSQLYVKHFMMAPGAQSQCVGCSLEVDHMTDILPHLENHDVSYAVVARAPIDEIEVVRQRMGWRFLWVSSFSNDFNYDFNVSFRPEDVAAGLVTYNYGLAQDWMTQLQDLSGRSVFYKSDTGEIFHTYSAYGRGCEDVLGIYAILDSMPKGRNEPIQHSMCDWVRPRNMYGKGGTTEPNGRYHAPLCGCSAPGR